MYESLLQQMSLLCNRLQYQENLLQYMDENNIRMVQMHKRFVLCHFMEFKCDKFHEYAKYISVVQ